MIISNSSNFFKLRFFRDVLQRAIFVIVVNNYRIYMNSIEIINKYDRLIEELGETIKNSPYKTQFFLDLLDIKRGFFYKKIKEKRFTSEEVKKLSKYLFPEDYNELEKKVIMELLEKSKKDIKAGSYRDFEEVLRESKEKYGL